MTKEEVRRVVVEEISKAQAAQTGQAPVLNDGMRPIGDLAGFDSPLAEDVTGVILLKLQMPAKALKCPFTRRTQGHYATLNQIVDEFCAAYARLVPVNA
jgi:hypothetical protein